MVFSKKKRNAPPLCVYPRTPPYLESCLRRRHSNQQTIGCFFLFVLSCRAARESVRAHEALRRKLNEQRVRLAGETDSIELKMQQVATNFMSCYSRVGDGVTRSAGLNAYTPPPLSPIFGVISSLAFVLRKSV